MNDLNTLRIAWHDAQRRALKALGILLETWEPLAHAQYDTAVRDEKTAENNYYRALAAGHKNDFKR